MAEAIDRATLARAVTEAVDSGRLTMRMLETEAGGELLLSGRLTLATLPLFEQLLRHGLDAAVTLRAAELFGDGFS
jgi:hypothetical protein